MSFPMAPGLWPSAAIRACFRNTQRIAESGPRCLPSLILNPSRRRERAKLYSIFIDLLLEESRSSEATVVARIYQPTRSAMQSGDAKSRHWQLEYEPDLPREAEPLMGWTSSADMKQQIVLRFPTKDEAIAYAIRNGIPYRVFEPHPRTLTKKAYADNFKYGRIGSWTH
jgi:hypothetical protein